MPFDQQLDGCATRWDAAELLLLYWQQVRPPDDEAARQSRDDGRANRFYALVDDVRGYFDNRPDDFELSTEDRTRLAEWTAHGTQADNIDAVGQGLNMAGWSTFAPSWRQGLGEEVHRMQDGECFPVPEAPWPEALGDLTRLPAPYAAGFRSCDHPYARVFTGASVAVDVDFSHARALRPILDGLHEQSHPIATLHPNQGLEELGITGRRGSYFPIAPADPDNQMALIDDLLDEAIDADARVIVLPELSGSLAIAERIARRLDAEDVQRLVIPGSWHTDVRGRPANVTRGLISGHPDPMRHRKLTEISDLLAHDPGHRFREGVEAGQPPTLTVHVAGAYRLAVLICKDLLDAGVRAALELMGVNVLLVPAMSPTTGWFVDRALGQVASAQAITVMANGPAEWAGDETVRPDPSAMLARPFEPEQIAKRPYTGAPACHIFTPGGS